MAFVFYDTETTGKETFYDQILQFAAIRTDAELNVLERFEIRSRILPHIVPAPGAMKVTGVRASQLIDPSLPSHYEMVREVRAKLMSWSPATFIGYNSFDFDESILRQALYKTLHHPYLTNSHGNTRSDMMYVAHAASLFVPDSLVIPEDEAGKRIFKLERMAPANGFQHDRAHDALADVEATIHLCRLVAERAPEVWSANQRFSQKAAVVDYVTNEMVFCLSDFYFNRPYSWFVTALGTSKHNPNEWIAFDLAQDPEALRAYSDEKLTARLAKSPKILRKFKSNETPVICSTDDAPSICSAGGCDLDELQRRAEFLHGDHEFRARLLSLLDGLKEEYPPSPHIEGQIYDGFFGKGDSLLMDKFHSVPWEERLAIVESFEDERLRKIGWQLIHHERPHLLSAEVQQQHREAAGARLLGRCEAVSWTTLPDAITEIDAILLTAEGDEITVLQEHRTFLQQLLDQATRRAA